MRDLVPYAHTLPDQPEERWEPLEVHLREVAELAGEFAEAFGARPWGEAAGRWHDLGKFKPQFQARIRGEQVQVEHAGVGAALAASKGGLGQAIAFVIAGHHAGLANRAAQGDSTQLSLRERLAKNLPELQRLSPTIPADLVNRPLPTVPPHLDSIGMPRSDQERFARRVEFWTRFLFSALVDADFLATEAFYETGRRDFTREFASVAELRAMLDAHLARFRGGTRVNSLRAQILDACRAAAPLAPGLFSLTVPTGGGKTLSSLAFALRHAELHGLRRVIVVIPYTSIIEQNAAVYRDVFGTANVIEHHSNIDEAKRQEENSTAELRRRLAAENWDAPIVVTTNVQFFESLFANRPGRCRKLHNIARSVVVIDEAQSLPTDFLNCALDAMRELTDHYGCSLVLMTATQPALKRRDSLPAGLKEVHEIIPDPDQLARALERVRIHWPTPGTEATGYAELAETLLEHDRALAIVHLRKDARVLAQCLPVESRLHLSALMCPAHRTEVLAEARSRLGRGEPCLLIATQLIEAGVDISFPVVYRALAGLDSLAQAAGRCNREGELHDAEGNPRRGEFHVFRAETRPPPGFLRMGMETMDTLLTQHGGGMNFADSTLLENYFRMLYAKCEPDRKGVQAERSQLNFATVAERVRLIEDAYSHPVVVPWADSERRAAAFQASPNRETQRALQPYLVQIPERELNKLRALGAVEWVHESVHVLTGVFRHLYDPEFGLVVDEEANADPETLCV
jgi:CRISPR-associated endonuclease/helicase Cas3